MASTIPTKVFILSDTHGAALRSPLPSEHIDVAIHCGDLTQESKLHEFRGAIRQLQDIGADLTLVVAGNHDWTLDDAVFRRKVAEMRPSADDVELVEREYGRVGDVRRVLEAEGARAKDVVFLDEGTYSFGLANGGLLTVYASPYTPSTNDWGFSYDPKQGHDWNIGAGVNIAITHGPPRGVPDYTSSRQRAGSPGLFAAIARARPQVHCFGHIHEAWGAKTVGWIEEPSEEPSHFTDIDNEASELVESLASLRAQKFDGPDRLMEKAARRAALVEMGYSRAVAPGLDAKGRNTLFVNAAIEDEGEEERQWPWLIDLELPRARHNT